MLKIGVAGAGVFGGFHASKVLNNPRAKLIGIYDRFLEAAQKRADDLGINAYDDLGAFLNDIDAIIIATPATTHFEIAVSALKANKHAMIEKPIAPKNEHGEKLVKLANERNLILQIGHQERYIFKAMGLLDIFETPKYIYSKRIGLPSPRGSDVSATLDLMVHDIDLAQILFKSPVKTIKAKRLSGSIYNPDAIESEIIYENGARAEFIASRAADIRDRGTIIEYASGKVEIDYINKTFTDNTGFNLNADFADRIKDPMLQANLDFTASILDGAPVFIKGEEGLLAAKIANAIDDATRA